MQSIRWVNHLTPVLGLSEAAFVLVVSPKKTNVIAAKGIWQVEMEVTVAGKPGRADSTEVRQSGLPALAIRVFWRQCVAEPSSEPELTHVLFLETTLEASTSVSARSGGHLGVVGLLP